MYYLFNLSRNGKNYGSVDDSNNNNNNNALGEPDSHNMNYLETGIHPSMTDPLSPPPTPANNATHSTILLNIDDAINRLPMGRFHYQILITAGLLLAADSIQSVLLSFLSRSQMESMMHKNNNNTQTQNRISDYTASGLYYPTPAEEAQQQMTDITMVVFPGALVGALVLGMLGDVVGRRPVFCYMTAPLIAVFGLGTAVVSASPTLANEWLLLTSFMVAFGVGGLTVPFDTFSEVLAITHRGRYLIYLQIFWTCGALLVHLILDSLLLQTDTMEEEEKALFVMVPQLHATINDAIAFSASWEWVVLVLVCAIPCVFATLLGFIVVPESPRWLVAKGYPDRALDILRQAVNTNGGDADHFFPQGTMLYTNEHTQTWSSICNLCSADWMKVTSALWATYFGLAFLDHGTMTLTVSVFSNDARQQDYQAIFRSTSELVGLFLALCLIDKWGRVRAQRWSYLGGGVSCVIISILISPVDETNDNLLLILAFWARMLVTSGTATTWIATSEVLATEIRTSRHAIANAVGRIGGFVASYVFLQITSLPATGAVLFAISLWTVVASGGLPETNTKEMGLAHIPASLLESFSRRRSKNRRNKQTRGGTGGF